jgi:hypothetical protein
LRGTGRGNDLNDFDAVHICSDIRACTTYTFDQNTKVGPMQMCRRGIWALRMSDAEGRHPAPAASHGPFGARDSLVDASQDLHSVPTGSFEWSVYVE